MSVATTRPEGATRDASQDGTAGPPAPTSQQAQPSVIPSASMRRRVQPSNVADSEANRSPASLAWLSSA
jgi:hypothetical protein